MAGEIFISYRRADQAKAKLLHDLLTQRGVDAWYDALLDAGDDWRSKTANALVKAPIFVLLFSKAASESDDISKELAAATFQKKIVIPVRIEDIRPEGAFLYELASRNWFDAFHDTEDRMVILADRLAALVKGKPEEAKAAADKLGAAMPAKVEGARRGWLHPLALGGMAVGGLAVAFGLFSVLNPSGNAGSAQTSSRVAFFGISATGEDAAAASVAAYATDEIFRYLGVRRVDVAARGETTGEHATGPRLDRARALDARFALSGEARREGDKVQVSFRLEDVATRAALWEGGVEGDAARPRVTATSAVSAAAGVTSCVARKGDLERSGPVTEDLLPLLVQACGAGTASEQTRAMRELARLRPGDGIAQAWVAIRLPEASFNVPVTAHLALLEEADAALQKATALRPDAYVVAQANKLLALWHDIPPVMWLPEFERSLEREPAADEMVDYAMALEHAVLPLLAMGRLNDALTYAHAAVDANPVAAEPAQLLAFMQAATGGFEADTAFDQLLAKRPRNDSWELAMAMALFVGRGADPDKLLEPQMASLATPLAVRCYRDLRAALKSSAASARRAGAKKADACLNELQTPHIALMAYAALGDIDTAFERAQDIEFSRGTMQYTFSPLFLPSGRAMRADERFLPLMEQMGYVEYWRTIGTLPDICWTDEEVIPLCVALRE